MRAVWLTRFGPPQMLAAGQAPDPRPGEGEVLVGAEFAGVTFIETQLRAGRPPRPGAGWTLPVIPGNGVGGVIVATGPGADPALAGTRVVSSTGGTGGYAQLAAVPAGTPVPVPDGLAMADAVALLADGRTAVGLIRATALRGGERVLAAAAAGRLRPVIGQRFPLAGAARAHAAIESRATTGKTLLAC